MNVLDFSTCEGDEKGAAPPEGLFIDGGGFFGGADSKLGPESPGPALLELPDTTRTPCPFARKDATPNFGGGAFESEPLLPEVLPLGFTRDPPVGMREHKDIACIGAHPDLLSPARTLKAPKRRSTFTHWPPQAVLGS